MSLPIAAVTTDPLDGTAGPPDWTGRYGKAVSAIRPPPSFLALAQQPGIISFAAGAPDARLFPFNQIAECHQRILADPQKRAAALQYAPSTGLLSLRQWIALDMKRRHVDCHADSILITNGAQQALDLIGKLLINPGDLVAVTAPTFFAALDTLSAYRPEFACIDMDEAGLHMAALEKTLRRKPKFLYLVPDFQNPTGLSIPENQRREIIQAARDFGVPIIEDAAYDRLVYDGSPIPSLAGIAGKTDQFNPVIHVNTFSKTIVPGMRIGWIQAAKPVVEKLAALKLSTDIHSSTLNQMVVEDFARQYMNEHIPRLCETYSSRRDAMLAALKRHMPGQTRWTKPRGGLFVWLTLPDEIETTRLFQESVQDYRVAFVPGALSHPHGACKNAIRLSFATVDEPTIDAGINRLASLITTKLVGTNRRSPCVTK